MTAIVLVASRAHAEEPTSDEDPPNWGVQLGGPGFFEVVYRPRIAGPVLLEIGAMVAGGGGGVGNGSAGLVIELARSGVPYLGVTGGGAFACGESEEGLGCSTMAFVSGRVGAALPDRHGNRFTLDGGAWLGKAEDGRNTWTFLIPMAGIGYYW